MKNKSLQIQILLCLVFKIISFSSVFAQPQAVCRNYTAQITPNGVVVVSGQNLNNGSTGYSNLLLMYNGALQSFITFNCNSVGQNLTIGLVAVDSAGNQSICYSVVTITAMANVCNTSYNMGISTSNASNCNTCNGQITVTGLTNSTGGQAPGPYTYLWSNGATTASISNACPNNFYMVTLTAGNGLNYMGSATVGCNSSPNAVCNAYTAAFTPNLVATVNAQQLSTNSIGGQAFISMNGQLVNSTSFNCSHIGNQNVQVIVRDSLGNTSSCVATVYVVDPNNYCGNQSNLPQAICNSQLSYDLGNPNGPYAIITPQTLNNNSINASSMWMITPSGSVVYGPYTLSCNDIGLQAFTLVVSNSSNISSNTASYDSCVVWINVTDTLHVCSAGNSNYFVQDSMIPSSCTGACTGIFVVYNVYLATGQIAPQPYTVVWSDGYTGSSRYNLCGNQTYSMIIYDALQNAYNHSITIGCTNSSLPNSCIDTTRINNGINCPTGYVPVCGCNGITYPNACVAANHYGLLAWTSGPCPGNNSNQPIITVTGSGCNATLCTGSATIQFPGATPNNFWTLVWSDSITQTGSGSQLIRNGLCPGVYTVQITGNTNQNYFITVVIGTQQGCVWPGDADDNTVVNNWDLLPIAQTFGATGNLRPNASINWVAQSCASWNVSNPIAGLPDYKHIDCNGDGVINQTDLSAVQQNYGLSYYRGNQSSLPGNIPFFINSTNSTEGSSVQIPIQLGTATDMALAYGIAFTIEYDPNIVVPGSAFVDFNSSWLGTNLMEFQYDFSQLGKIEVAVSRKNQTNQNGFGQIGQFNFTLRNNILGNSSSRIMNLNLSQIKLVQNNNTVLGTNVQPATVTITAATAVEYTDNSSVQIFPNPADNQVSVQSKEMMSEIKLYNLSGQLIYHNTESRNNTIISLDEFPAGIYNLQINTSKGITNQKLIIR